ncbi:MAG: substrate-binding domain-containing protein [Lancefieldella parvula]|uniref:Substrate-binding domain-containing protein n=1 Tax=Lancefieldella parvula TaxID=1382 RepID=A0A9E7ACC3_9ACTN|nr:MAG: substrate-binding domain-containing protein [Lancefieldella parvula]
MHVPRDYSVVGYDNSISDALFEPALTSIEQNVDELSDAALSIMFRRLGEHGADVGAGIGVGAEMGVAASAGEGAAAGSSAGADIGTDLVSAKITGIGLENADGPVDDGASIQIILEPRMIEKNSVRVLGR